MADLRAASAIAAACFALTACGHHRPRPVPAAEWKAVINDWLADGRFDHPHTCAAVRAAERQLSDLGKASYPDAIFHRYETKVC